MRKIKFRGMDISGEWCYGNLIKSQNAIDAGAYVSNSMGLPFAYKVRPGNSITIHRIKRQRRQRDL